MLLVAKSQVIDPRNKTLKMSFRQERQHAWDFNTEEERSFLITRFLVGVNQADRD